MNQKKQWQVEPRAGLTGLALLAWLFVVSVQARAVSPDLNRITPHGGQAGTEVEVTFSGARLGDAQEVLYYDQGISTVSLEPDKNNNAVKVRFKIAPDCRLGEHRMRLRTAGGVTELQTFYVGPFPSADEKEPNSDFATPQAIGINSTVHGVVENEDVDYFVVEAKKGQRISAEIEAIRLGVTLFDPYIAILNEKRFELAASDDTALLLQDAAVSVVAPEDGKYIIQVRETSYGGNGSCVYRLHVGHFPRPRGVYPAGGKAGTELPVRFIGDVKGAIETKLKLPAEEGAKFGLFAEHEGLRATSPNWIRVSGFDNVLEAEPNDGLGQATATGAALPLAFNGIIEKDGDVDCFKFSAKKGQQYDVRVYARELRSPLDSVLNVYDAKDNKHLAGNDDSGGPDSYLRFGVPHDGEFVIRVNDHLNKGGEAYVYRVEVTPVSPSLAVTFPQIDQNAPQRQQTVAVPRGNRYAMMIDARRTNFGGPITLKGENLPGGVTVSSQGIPGNLNSIPVLFEAAADAPIAGTLAQLAAAHEDEKTGIKGGFVQDVALVLGPPNNTRYYNTEVNRMAVAVTEEAPFKIRIIEPKVPLVRSGQLDLKVVAERAPGFDEPITLRMLFNPPGVGSANEVTIPKGQNEAMYPLNANGGAQINTWKIVMVGRASHKGGTVEASTQLADLRVAEPYVTLEIQMAATEQGKNTDLICKLQQHHAFEGQAKAILFGLPAHTASEERSITKDAKELIFPIKVEEKARAGQHKTLFCQIIVMENGEMIRHNLGGGGVLRIDPPPPAPKKPEPVAKKEEKPKPEPEKKPEKRLSRLEQLRLEQQKRAEEAAAEKKK